MAVLSGSHRLTHIASDLATRALAAQAGARIAGILHRLILKICRFFAWQTNIAGFSQKVFLTFQTKLMGFRIAMRSKRLGGVRFKSRRTSRSLPGRIARFGPLRLYLRKRTSCPQFFRPQFFGGAPSTVKQFRSEIRNIISELCCPKYGWYPFLFWKGPLYGTARAGYEIPNSSGGTSEF